MYSERNNVNRTHLLQNVPRFQIFMEWEVSPGVSNICWDFHSKKNSAICDLFSSILRWLSVAFNITEFVSNFKKKFRLWINWVKLLQEYSELYCKMIFMISWHYFEWFSSFQLELAGSWIVKYNIMIRKCLDLFVGGYSYIPNDLKYKQVQLNKFGNPTPPEYEESSKM